MIGNEHAFDLQELIKCANTLNQLFAVEYAQNGLKFGKQHNKHPLHTKEVIANLADYSRVTPNKETIAALKEGLQEAQRMIIILGMAPSTVA